MTDLQFISSLVGQLAWPIVVLIILAVFRHQLAALIVRVTSYEGFGQKIAFGTKLAGAEEKVSVAVGTSQSTSSPKSVNEVEPSPLVREAEANPSYVIISSWERLASTLRDLLGALGAPTSPRLTMAGLSRLRRNGLLTNDFVLAVQALRELRNQVAHGLAAPTSGEAVAYAESTTELERAALNLIATRTSERASTTVT